MRTRHPFFYSFRRVPNWLDRFRQTSISRRGFCTCWYSLWCCTLSVLRWCTSGPNSSRSSQSRPLLICRICLSWRLCRGMISNRPDLQTSADVLPEKPHPRV